MDGKHSSSSLDVSTGCLVKVTQIYSIQPSLPSPVQSSLIQAKPWERPECGGHLRSGRQEGGHLASPREGKDKEDKGADFGQLQSERPDKHTTFLVLPNWRKQSAHTGDTERTQELTYLWPNRRFQFRFHFHFILRQGLCTGPWLPWNCVDQAGLDLTEMCTPLPLECLNLKHESPSQAQQTIFFLK